MDATAPYWRLHIIGNLTVAHHPIIISRSNEDHAYPTFSTSYRRKRRWTGLAITTAIGLCVSCPSAFVYAGPSSPFHAFDFPHLWPVRRRSTASTHRPPARVARSCPSRCRRGPMAEADWVPAQISDHPRQAPVRGTTLLPPTRHRTSSRSSHLHTPALPKPYH